MAKKRAKKVLGPEVLAMPTRAVEESYCILENASLGTFGNLSPMFGCTLVDDEPQVGFAYIFAAEYVRDVFIDKQLEGLVREISATENADEKLTMMAVDILCITRLHFQVLYERVKSIPSDELISRTEEGDKDLMDFAYGEMEGIVNTPAFRWVTKHPNQAAVEVILKSIASCAWSSKDVRRNKIPFDGNLPEYGWVCRLCSRWVSSGVPLFISLEKALKMQELHRKVNRLSDEAEANLAGLDGKPIESTGIPMASGSDFPPDRVPLEPSE